MVLLLLFYLLIPAFIIWLCRKLSFLNKIGVVLILYVLGVIVGNLPIMPEDAFSLQDILSSAIVPIAIPMMLFNSDFRKFSIKKSLLTLLCGIVAVVVTVILGFILFKDYLGDEAYKIGGMLTGVYTGGTPNLAALKLMLDVKDETYILLNSYDMMVSFLYLVFLMSIGIRLFRKILPNTGITKKRVPSQDVEFQEYQMVADPYVGILKKKYIVQMLKAFLLSLVILAISAGLATLVKQQYFMVVIILSLTTLGIAASFVKPVQKLEKSYDFGMYLIYVFSVVVASMADLTSLDFKGGIYMLLYIVFVIFLSLLLQTFLSKIFRIDADTMVISSVALINSPPLVPVIAASMRNKDAIIVGLSVGIIGYAVGNYLGFLIAEFLSIL